MHVYEVFICVCVCKVVRQTVFFSASNCDSFHYMQKDSYLWNKTNVHNLLGFFWYLGTISTPHKAAGKYKCSGSSRHGRDKNESLYFTLQSKILIFDHLDLSFSCFMIWYSSGGLKINPLKNYVVKWAMLVNWQQRRCIIYTNTWTTVYRIVSFVSLFTPAVVFCFIYTDFITISLWDFVFFMGKRRGGMLFNIIFF